MIKELRTGIENNEDTTIEVGYVDVNYFEGDDSIHIVLYPQTTPWNTVAEELEFNGHVIENLVIKALEKANSDLLEGLEPDCEYDGAYFYYNLEITDAPIKAIELAKFINAMKPSLHEVEKECVRYIKQMMALRYKDMEEYNYLNEM